MTQCPIPPGGRYTYRFNIIGQEGTLWWHAHSSYLRATVYGSFIIHPRAGAGAYPFPKPYREVPLLLGKRRRRSNLTLIHLTLNSEKYRNHDSSLCWFSMTFE